MKIDRERWVVDVLLLVWVLKSEILIAPAQNRGILHCVFDLHGAVKIKFGFLVFSHLLVADSQVVPSLCIIGQDVYYHPQCLDRRVKILVVHIQHAN